jgi:DNA replication protein DnaC
MTDPLSELIPDTAETICQICGVRFSYEPIMFGERDLALSVELHCQKCTADLEHAARDEARAREMAERLALFRRTVPPALWPQSLDPDGTDIDRPEFNRPLWKIVSRWRPVKKGDRIAVVGPAGQCKTRCLALLAHSLIMRGNQVMWTSAMRFHEEATFNLRSRDRAIQARALAYLDECRTSPWLIVDEIGSNNLWGADMESQLFTVLNYRMDHFLPMAFSSNRQPEEFRNLITKVDPTAFIGRLINRASIFDCTPDTQIPLKL